MQRPRDSLQSFQFWPRVCFECRSYISCHLQVFLFVNLVNLLVHTLREVAACSNVQIGSLEEDSFFELYACLVVVLITFWSLRGIVSAAPDYQESGPLRAPSERRLGSITSRGITKALDLWSMQALTIFVSLARAVQSRLFKFGSEKLVVMWGGRPPWHICLSLVRLQVVLQARAVSHAQCLVPEYTLAGGTI